MRQAQTDRRRMQRIEELNRDLSHRDPARVAYARQTLLTMLWLGDAPARLQMVHALCRSRPEETEEPTEFAVRLCAELQRETDDAAGAPPGEGFLARALALLLDPAVLRLKLLIDNDPTASPETLYKETDLCRDALTFARCFAVDTVVESAVRLLRLFPPDLARGVGPLARQTGPLREVASLLLGSLSPDRLYAYWYALGSPDRSARRDLLPVLDYVNDPRATAYLVRLFERRGQWADGEMVGWFVVRAFKRIQDRRALPTLRRVVNTSCLTSCLAEATDPDRGASPELIREVQRAIEAIQYARAPAERTQLLRASQPPIDQLVRPGQPSAKELLLPSRPQEKDLLHPADPAAHQLLRGASAPADHLLRAVSVDLPQKQGAHDSDELVRAYNDPQNPFEQFDPNAELGE